MRWNGPIYSQLGWQQEGAIFSSSFLQVPNQNSKAGQLLTPPTPWTITFSYDIGLKKFERKKCVEFPREQLSFRPRKLEMKGSKGKRLGRARFWERVERNLRVFYFLFSPFLFSLSNSSFYKLSNLNMKAKKPPRHGLETHGQHHHHTSFHLSLFF